MDMVGATTSKFKAEMGQYMRAVREGKEVVITDRDEPIARVVRFEVAEQEVGVPIAIPRDPTAPALGDLVAHPIEWHGRATLELLAEDRKR